MYMQGAPTRDLTAAWSQVATFVSDVEARLGRWLTSTHGLGLTEYRALMHLSKASDKELRVNDLAHQVGLNQSSVTRLLSRLEEKALVYRDTCPDDGRGVFAVITDKGDAVVGEVRGPFEAIMSDAVRHIASQSVGPDGRSLDRALTALCDHVADM